MGESGGGRGPIQALAQTPFCGATSPLHEDEFGRATVARVRQGALSTARGHPCIEHLDGDGFERHRALGAELADQNAQPRAVLPEVHQAVEFKVEQLDDADAGGAQKDEPSPSEWVVEVLVISRPSQRSSNPKPRGIAPGSVDS